MADRMELAEALHEAEHGLCACDYLDQSYLDQADDLLPWLTGHDAELRKSIAAAIEAACMGCEMAVECDFQKSAAIARTEG